MPNLVPSYSKKNCFKKRRDWKKYNTYFDENTIKLWDKFYKDESGIKEAYYKLRGVEYDSEPWKKVENRLDITPRKLAFY